MAVETEKDRDTERKRQHTDGGRDHSEGLQAEGRQGSRAPTRARRQAQDGFALRASARNHLC